MTKYTPATQPRRNGRYVAVFTREEALERRRVSSRRRLKAWREANREEYRRLAREAQQRRREKLYRSLAQPKSWRMACSICLQFGHKSKTCSLLRNT